MIGFIFHSSIFITGMSVKASIIQLNINQSEIKIKAVYTFRIAVLLNKNSFFYPQCIITMLIWFSNKVSNKSRNTK